MGGIDEPVVVYSILCEGLAHFIERLDVEKIDLNNDKCQIGV